MSSLSLALLVLAALGLLGVIGYNTWLGRVRLGGSRGAPRHSGPDVTAARDGRGEPSLGDVGEPDLGEDAGEGLPPGLTQVLASAGNADGLPPVRPERGFGLDPRLDCIVELELPAPVPGERILPAARALRRAGNKPVLVEGLPAAESPEGAPVQWEPLSAGVDYAHVRAGVLLANRHGPLNGMEFSEFVGRVQTLAELLGALADTPEMSPVLARARELDARCAELDTQVGLIVEAPETLGVGDLARLAAEAACTERGNSLYAMLGPEGDVLFSLALSDAPNRLSLLLDLPRAPSEAEPWEKMVACARLCAQRLGGILMDEAGRPLPDAQLDAIGTQIRLRVDQLVQAGFPPASMASLRLFN